MWQKLSQIILRNRILILSLIFVITCVFAYFAFTSLKLDNKYGNMLPKESPAQSTYLKFKKMFGEDGGALVIAVHSDDLYTESNFRKWKELGDSILKYDGVNSVVSEASLVTVNNNIEEERFEVEKIFTDPTYQEKSIDSIRREIRQNPIYDGILYNDSTKVSLMMIAVDESFLSDQKKSQVVVNIEALADSYEEDFGKIHYAGLPHIRVIIGKRVMGEMYIFIALAIAVTSLLLFIFFRSFRVVGICNLVVFTAVIWSMGIIGMCGFKLSILMALIPPLMIVIGIPNCIFLLTKFHREVKDHGNKTKALSRVIVKIGNATFLTNLTTALGFSTFIFTNSEKLIEFGIIASINILMVFVLSICIIPIVFSLSKMPKTRHLKHLERTFTARMVNKMVFLTNNKRALIYVVTFSLMAICIFGATKIEATGNITSDLPADDPILLDINFIQDNFNGAIPFEIMVDYKKEGRKFNKTMLTKIDNVQSHLAKDTIFSKSISAVNVMKLINMAYYNNNPNKYKLISGRDRARLGRYFKNFQTQMDDTKLLYAYLDSLGKGRASYGNRIYMSYPDVKYKAISIASNKENPYATEKADSTLTTNDSINRAFFDNYDVANIEESDLRKAVKEVYPKSSMSISLTELVDTTNTTMRIRMQMLDLGSYVVAEKMDSLKVEIDSILNPDKVEMEAMFAKVKAGKKEYIDSLVFDFGGIYNNLTGIIADGNEDIQYELDLDPEKIKEYYSTENFNNKLRQAINEEYLDFDVTGTAVVASEGTQYLVKNLFTSLIIAICIIAVLMALLFRSWKMVIISLIPNFIPLLVTAGIMGYFQIPIKPSTILVFSIAFGISVDDTIHFLAKYRQELKVREYDLKACVINALRETGLSMFYTSIVLFCGFSMFALSQFGGTQALGLLVSLTLLVAMVTNLLTLPSLLLTLEKRVANKAFKEPYIDVFDEEEDIELDDLEIERMDEE